MLSQKQLDANRANAQRSTGPVTEPGKQRSRLNALRHGLTAQVAVMPEEDRAAYDAFTNPIVESLQPATPLERQLAVTIATWHWRINRTAAMEEGIFVVGNFQGAAEDLQIDHAQIHNSLANSVTYCEQHESFQQLSLYSNRLIAQADRLLRQLQQLQAERKSQEQKELDDAVLLQQLADTEGTPFQPAQNGFVFSPAAVRRHLDRKIRIERALAIHKADSKPHPNPRNAAA